MIRQGIGPIVLGLAGGGLVGWMAQATLLPNLLRAAATRGVSSTAIWALTAAVALLLAIGLLACYLPARRAARVDPNVALRAL